MSPVDNYGHRHGRLSAIRTVLISTSVFAASALLATSPGGAQTAPQSGPPTSASGPDNGNLPQIKVSGKRKNQGKKKNPKNQALGPTASNNQGNAPPRSSTGPLAGIPMTPLNTVAPSSTRLNLPVLETPASVDVITQQTMQEQGYRTTAEIAKGAVGVLDVDSAGAPANFSMRGFRYGEVNVLYNGISIGIASDTSRVMDTYNLDQVEFLKGPSALMSGMDAIGGAVNLVNKQPFAGPIQNELDTSVDSLGSLRSHYGSGGSTAVQGLDYRVDMTESKLNGFVDDDWRALSDFSTQLNYRVTDTFKTFVAIEYKKDYGHSYWGTPLVPASFAGSHAISGVVSGSAASTFFTDATPITGVTIDSRTLTTNYNVADNATGAQELWLRSGFEWTPLTNVSVKNQVYYYDAKRNWVDSETYAFDNGTSAFTLGAGTIDRDRFFVDHRQYVAGNNADFLWDSRLLGMENRFAAQLQVSRNWITFVEEGNGGYPQDAVTVVNPDPEFYGAEAPNIRNKVLDDVAGAFEDRLKITPQFALIGGVRVDDWTLKSSGVNFDGSTPGGQPFSQVWKPVSYRAAATYEPIKDMVFYGMYATSYDPAAADIFSVNETVPLALTSASIYETGVKQLLWNGRAEWTFAAYDITRRNVYVPISTTVSALAGEIGTKGYELAGAIHPWDGWKFWSNIAWTHARYENFDAFDLAGNFVSYTGNTPSNVAPIIFNAGVSYRYEYWRWPVEIGGSVRHVGARFLYEDDATTMDAYTTADAYAFVDIPGRDMALPEVKTVRATFRVRNLTNAVYAAFSDPTYPDQIYLGEPRTYELAVSTKW